MAHFKYPINFDALNLLLTFDCMDGIASTVKGNLIFMLLHHRDEYSCYLDDISCYI